MGFVPLATAVAIFLLYTNLPVVASQRGLLPGSAAGAVPFLLLVAVAVQLLVYRRRIVIDRTFGLMTAFLVVLLLSSFAAVGQVVAIERITIYLGEGLLIYFLVRNAIRTLPQLRAALFTVLAAGSLLAGIAVTQNVTDNYENEFIGLSPRSLEHLEGLPASAREEVSLEDRARGPVDDPNRFAQILLMVLPLAVIFGMNAGRKRGAVLAWGCAGLLMAGVLLTYSRGALLTVVVMMVAAAPLGLIRPGRLVGVLAVSAVLTLVAVPGLADRVATMAGVAGLFGPSTVEPDGPTRGRTTQMLAALAAYMDHPVLGVGPGQYFAYHSVEYQSIPEIAFRDLPDPRRAHNLYLEIAADTGTTGLVVFMAIPLLLLLDLRRHRRFFFPHRPELARLAAGFSLALLAYLGTGMFLHLAFERYYWLLVALTAAAVGVMKDWAAEDESVDSGAVTHHRSAIPSRGVGSVARPTVTHGADPTRGIAGANRGHI